jgi:peroxiredoxin
MRFMKPREIALLSIISLTLSVPTVGDEPVTRVGKAKFNKVLAPGDRAPDWKDLPGTDGKSHSLADFPDATAIVIVFTCNHCPVAKQYEERLTEFAKRYEKRVQVVAISVSRNDADRLERMKVRAEEAGFAFPYVRDESQQSGRAYGATVTPHFFVLDRDRRIAYMGAFDDNIFEPEKVEKHYLVDAVEAVLRGLEPRVRESLQRGCAIQYDGSRGTGDED